MDPAKDYHEIPKFVKASFKQRDELLKAKIKAEKTGVYTNIFRKEKKKDV